MRGSLAAAVLLALPLSAAFRVADIPRAYESSTSDRIFVADLDRDGNVDVVLDGSPLGSILYGRGDGTFDAPVSIGTLPVGSSGVAGVMVADVDGDQLPDVIYRAVAPDRIMLAKNLGGRRFQETQLLFGYASLVATSDLNRDSFPDYLFDASPDSLLFLNDGRGAFGQNRVLSGITTYGQLPAAGDIDGDGDLDLAVSPDAFLHLYANDGTGGFKQLRQLSEPGSVPVFADLDRDGRAELVVLRYASNELALYRGANLDGPAATFRTGLNPAAAIPGDFNRDGALDLAVLNLGLGTEKLPPDTASITIHLGDGSGRLSQGAEVFLPRSGRKQINAADVNRDGNLDLLVPVNAAMAVILGNGDGTFRFPPTVPGLAGHELRAAADFDGDGIDELILGNRFATPPLRGAWLNADGTYRFDTIPVETQISSPVVAGSLSDGGDKLVIGDRSAVHVLSASAFGQWSKQTFSAGEPVRMLQLWRDGGDGRIAAITGESVTLELKVFTPDGTLVYSYPLYPSPAREPYYRNPFRIDAVDVDRDGRKDLILTALTSPATFFHDRRLYTDSYVLLFCGRADGTFATPELLLVDRPLSAASVADLNADGAADIAFEDGIEQRVLYGDGAGHFREELSPLGFTPELVADFNLDGLADFKKGATIVYGTGRRVQYLESAIGTILARR
ncbi:MAG TPA: FG-GAP-like repeat-containing protein, partial [Thermoanaerobaculia bacterium]|nr:FG-GAP-like repeat-containing protein [Thermoanaerobaculia bacterium]